MMYINNKWFTETEVKAYVDKLIEENEKMKTLLKAAVDDFKALGTQAEDEYGRCSLNDSVCDYCVLGGGNLADDCQWRYADKALKLIGEDGERND